MPKLLTVSAFTFIEVLIVLSIIIIVTAITFPFSKNFLNYSQDELLQKQLLHAISYAKSEAKLRHTSVALCKSDNQVSCQGNWKNGQLIFVDEYEDGVVHDAKQIILGVQPATKHGDLHWRSFPIYRNYLLFLAKGLDNNNGTFWHCHDDGSAMAIWAIALNKAGRARVLYPEKDGVIRDAQGKPLSCE